MSTKTFPCGHTKDQEHALFLDFVDGLRQFIKESADGKFQGTPLAANWSALSEREKDTLISECFVRNVHFLTTAAHVAIHGKM